MKRIVIYLENLDKNYAIVSLIKTDDKSNHLEIFNRFVANYDDKNYRIIGVPLLLKNIKAINSFNIEDKILIFDCLSLKKEIKVYDQQIKDTDEAILNFFKE